MPLRSQCHLLVRPSNQPNAALSVSGIRWCEHDPLEIWESVRQCLEGALSAASAAVGDLRVAALGVTNQRETTLTWDRATGRPLYNAIVWHDSRTAAICRSVANDCGAVCKHFRVDLRLHINTQLARAEGWKARAADRHCRSTLPGLRAPTAPSTTCLPRRTTSGLSLACR